MHRLAREMRDQPFTHVLVDEAQDISVAELHLIAVIAGGQPNGLFFAGVAIVNELVRNEALVAWAAGQLGRSNVDPADVWVSFRGVLWIASSVFGLSNIPLIMRNMVKDDEPSDPMAPTQPDTAP